MCNKVANSGDVVIQEQGFSIADIHESASAIPLLLFRVNTMDSSCRNQIFPVGCCQGVRRLDSPGLYHITPVSATHRCGMSCNERHTSTLLASVSFLPSPTTILCHQQAFRMAIYRGRYPEVRKWWGCDGPDDGEGGTGILWWDRMRGTPFS